MMNDENKTTKSEQYRAINDYQKSKYDRITILVPKGDKEKYERIASQNNMSISQLFKYLVENRDKIFG